MMEKLFLNLVNISITAGYLVMAVLLLRPLLKRAPKYIRCILWALVGVRLLLPFSVESMLSIIPSAQTVPQDILYASQPQIHSGIPILNSTVNPVLSQSMAPTVGNSINPMQVAVGIAWNVWLLGMLAMAAYALISYMQLRYKLREAVWDKENIWLCDGVGSAFLLGIFRPRIYLPSALEENNKAFVVAHEKAHLQRKDHWWKPIGFLLLTVYWFNPLMWVAYIFLCRDIEYACDEKVIKQLGAGCKKSYSKALIDCSIQKKMISACPVAFGEEGVKGRIKSILNYKKPAFWLILIALIVCIAVAVCFLTNPVEPKSLFGYTYETGKCYYSFVVSEEKETQANSIRFIVDQQGNVTKDFGDNSQVTMGTLELSGFDLQTLDQMLVAQGHSRLLLGRRGKSFEICNAEGVRECVFFHKINGDVIYISFFTDGRVMNVFALDRKETVPEPAIEYSFNATVVETRDNAIIVVPSLYEDELEIADQFEIPMTQEQLAGVAIGNTVWIQYDGQVEELYPARIVNVYSVIRVAESFWYANPDRSFSSAVFDIDGDGVKENCYLNFGPTSGLFTVVVTAYENNVIEYATIYNLSHMDYAFCTLENGETVIQGTPYGSNEVQRILTVTVGKTQIVLEENGQKMQLWGSKDFVIPTTAYLRQLYPQFFDLSTAKGLEVYVWNNGTWRCGVRSGTNRAVTQAEIESFGEGVDLTEMAVILASYHIPRNEVSICYNYNPREPGYHEQMPSQGEQLQIESILTAQLPDLSAPITLPNDLTGLIVCYDQQYPMVIYAYQLGENVWQFQFVENTKPAASILDIMMLDSVGLEDAKGKLSQYDIPAEDIAVIVYNNPVSSYLYACDAQTVYTARELLGLN